MLPTDNKPREHMFAFRLLWLLLFLISSQHESYPIARWVLLLVFSFLVVVQPQYALFLPTVFMTTVIFQFPLRSSSVKDIKDVLRSRCARITALYALLGLFIHGFVRFSRSDSTFIAYVGNLLTNFDTLSDDYSTPKYSRIGYPGVEYGVLWYLKSLMLSPLSVYFSFLVTIQSVVQANIIAILASTYQAMTDNKNRNMTIVMALLYLTIEYYRMSPDIIMCFVTIGILLCQNAEVTGAVRQLPLLLLILLGTGLVSQVMAHVWLRLGTGNANYLFFQGLCMWVALGLFMVEYLKALLGCHTNVKLSSDVEKEKAE